jgi:hypothetical protein
MEQPFTDFPEYHILRERFGTDPETFLSKLSWNELECIARSLAIEFHPPFEPGASVELRRSSIIDAVISDFQNEGEDEEIVRAVEQCREEPHST